MIHLREIKYSIPQISFVRLKGCVALQNEVSILVDEENLKDAITQNMILYPQQEEFISTACKQALVLKLRK